MGNLLPPGDSETTVEYQHTRWNFVIIVADASVFLFGLAFVSPLVVLPVFMQRLTGSTVLVGVFSALQLAGWFLPQLVTASLVETRPRKQPFMLAVCVAGRLPLIVLPLLLFFAPYHPATVVGVLLGVYFFFYLTDGMTSVPWTDICAKTIPPRLRGRFFGSMQLIGGALSVVAGLVVRRLLGHPRLPYPHDYAVLFGLHFVLAMVSLGFLTLIREPTRPVRATGRSPGQLLRSAPALLRATPQFTRVMLVAWLMGAAAVATPFYVVFARVKLGLPEATAGLFVSAQMAGTIVSSVLWAWLSDRHGSRSVIVAAALCNLGAPLLALLAPTVLQPYGREVVGWGFCAIFFLVGACLNGIWLGVTNFVLELVGDQDRPSYIGLLNTLSTPAIALPVIGGWIVSAISYQAVFAIAAAAGTGGLVATAWLREPRAGTP